MESQSISQAKNQAKTFLLNWAPDLGDVAVTVEQGVVHLVAGPRPVEGLVDAVLEEANR